MKSKNGRTLKRMHNKPAVQMLTLIIDLKKKKKPTLFLKRKNTRPLFMYRRRNGDKRGHGLPRIRHLRKSDFHVSRFKKCVPGLLAALGKGLCLHKPNRGCAFTFPISGASSYITKILDSEMQDKIQHHMEREEKQMIQEAKHSLLMVTINQGYSEEVMVAATAAGAAGGTVVHARRLDSQETLKKWGISIQPEKRWSTS